MNMFKLFLDDVRKPSDVYQYITNEIYLNTDWYIATNYNEFIL